MEITSEHHPVTGAWHIVIRDDLHPYEYLAFPEDHPCIQTLGQYFKHLALLGRGEMTHNAFCRYCEPV